MSTKVENKGHRTLSVRVSGGVRTIKPGETATVDHDLGEREANALVLAGAKVSGVKTEEAVKAKGRGLQADVTPAKVETTPARGEAE